MLLKLRFNFRKLVECLVLGQFVVNQLIHVCPAARTTCMGLRDDRWYPLWCMLLDSTCVQVTITTLVSWTLPGWWRIGPCCIVCMLAPSAAPGMLVNAWRQHGPQAESLMWSLHALQLWVFRVSQR